MYSVTDKLTGNTTVNELLMDAIARNHSRDDLSSYIVIDLSSSEPLSIPAACVLSLLNAELANYAKKEMLQYEKTI